MVLCGGFSSWHRPRGPLGAPLMPGATQGKRMKKGAHPLQPACIPCNAHLFIVCCVLLYAPTGFIPGEDALLCTLLGCRGEWCPFPTSVGSPRSAVLTADDVSVGDVKAVGGYQGSALALSQRPVAAVVDMAAPARDTTSNCFPRNLPHHTWKVKEGPASNLR